jgi:probable rRNA maturation factor
VSQTSKTNIDVQIACADGDVPDSQQIQAWVAAVIADADVDVNGETEISVRVVDAEEMQSLNREYRDQDKPTNVLSFPAGELIGIPDDQARLLGDVVICAGVVSDEATEQGKALADHWGHMLVHGTLHLLGYDHIKSIEAAEMERLEVQILTSQGVADPYRVQ